MFMYVHMHMQHMHMQHMHMYIYMYMVWIYTGVVTHDAYILTDMHKEKHTCMPRHLHTYIHAAVHGCIRHTCFLCRFLIPAGPTSEMPNPKT